MLITLLVFLVILSILVLIHEAGHFISAKKLGIKVEEFGFGLPPRIIGFKMGETIYSLNWLPIGGFVRLFGEEGEDESSKTKGHKPKTKDRQRAFYARPVWQRAVVIIAGVVMNFVLGVVVISYLFTQGITVPVDRVHIEMVEKNSPAEKAGILSGDIVKEVSGKSVISGDDFINFTKEHLGEEIQISLIRGASLIHYKEINYTCDECANIIVTLVPRTDPPVKNLPQEPESAFSRFKELVRRFFGITDPSKKELPRQGPIGVAISSFETKQFPWYEAPFSGMKESVYLTLRLVQGIGIALWKLITFQSVGADVAGPLAIAQMTGEAVKFGKNAVLELMGILSLNLAIVNILPFPALDGGRLLFVIIEGITRKKVKLSWERYIHQIGLFILIALIILVSLNDLVRIFSK